jgi:hypothetical protein
MATTTTPALKWAADRRRGPAKQELAAHAHSQRQHVRILLGEIKAEPSGYCMDPRHETPCPLPCAACADECGSHVRQSAGGVTVTENEEKDGVEIRFASKPDPATLERIKSAGGWKWSRFSKCWYAKRNPATLAFAQSFLEVSA